MNPEDRLQFFIENGIRWVESQSDAHRLSARDLSETESAYPVFRNQCPQPCKNQDGSGY